MTTDGVTRPAPPVPPDAPGRTNSIEQETPPRDATAGADSTWGPRYLAVAGPHGLKRIVRADGLPLGTPARVSPPPLSERATCTTTFVSFGAAMRAAARRRARPGRRRTGRSEYAGPAPAREQLVRWRLEAGLGQRELARRCGLSRSTVAELEAGRRDSPVARRRVAVHLGHGDPMEWAVAHAKPPGSTLATASEPVATPSTSLHGAARDAGGTEGGEP
jgi:hypothetical protein